MPTTPTPMIAVTERSAPLKSTDSSRALRQLVTTESLNVVFQPIVGLQDGSLFACEALVRCHEPGLQNPLVLFERAVAAGCVGRLGRLIRQIALPMASPVPIFLNVHPLELQEEWLVRPDDPIYTHDHDVYLEITESVPLSHYQLCMDVLRDVTARGGLHLVVDDLGAGYSNLKRIADLEPKVVKLDRDLICGIDRSARQQQLVASVVRLCTDLNAAVVAEGIESEDELSALADTGAHYGQGYLFARPAYPVPRVTWPLSLCPTKERTSPPVSLITKGRGAASEGQLELDLDAMLKDFKLG